MSVASEINRINTNIANAYTELKNKDATIPEVENSEGLPSAIASIQTGVTPPTKGIIINEFDTNGYATDISVVGMHFIPSYYFSAYSTTYGNFLTKNLTNVNFPDNLKAISQDAFRNCLNLVLTTIPSGVEVINQNVFYGCKAITELTFNGDITTVGNNAFYNCSNLKKLILPNITSVPTLSNINAFSNTPIKSGTGSVYVPETLVESFQSNTNWSALTIRGISELPTQ